MNIVGHLAVAAAAGREPGDVEFLTGAVLPDVASMARTRIGHPEPGALADGIALHHATDTAFHGLRWFLDVSRRVHTTLVGHGVGDGPARACAHVGVELLLDGVFVEDDEVRGDARAVLAHLAGGPEEVLALAPARERDQWTNHVVRVGSSLDPQRYSDPAWVAERLHRITGTRPRLALAAGDVGIVGSVLSDIQPSVRDGAARTLAGVIAAVAPRRRRSVRRQGARPGLSTIQ